MKRGDANTSWKKRFVLVEVAIVLCSMFLMALPGIAAEQITQKASESEITTASKDDYVLGIYGNANEDDTIDMRDLTYVKLIFFGKKPETELADAKYDGKINPLDFIQIKLIIVGKEKKLTLVDSADRTVTIDTPVERAILFGHGEYDGEVIRLLRANDRVVGVSKYIAAKPTYFPELSRLPSVGSPWSPDYEQILSLEPDLVITYKTKADMVAEKLPGIPVIGMVFYKPSSLPDEVTKLGYILGERDAAAHYVNDFLDKYTGRIIAETEGLTEEEKPEMYMESIHGGSLKAYCGKSGAQQLMEMCGGRNIFAAVDAVMVEVDLEAVIVRDPDVIVRCTYEGVGYEADEVTELKAARDDIMSRPGFANVSAVKTGKVYITATMFNYGPDYPIAAVYWSKWLHPELFEDWDPKAVHQEWLTEFQGLDFDLDKHGVFVYHPVEHPDGQ